MARWSISPSAASPIRARFALAALAGHVALAALLLGHRPRPLPEPAALPALLLELAVSAPEPPAAAAAPLVATDLAEPPPAGPVSWPAPTPAPRLAAARPSLAPAAAIATQATAAAGAPVAAPVAAPGAVPGADPSALAAWQAALLAWIEQHRRYPPAARFRQEEGVVRVRFELDPAGRVLHAEILAESGSAALDTAALALLRGAILPAPPPGTDAAARLVTAPIRYRLN